jgi:type III pantothenate kinase
MESSWPLVANLEVYTGPSPCQHARGMTTLLIDNSNTRTKFALASGGVLRDWRACCPSADISEALLAELTAPATFDAAVISSVVPAKARVIRAFLGTALPIHEISSQSILPITIDYPAPEQIGADRLADAVAAFTRFGAPSIVIDFGTAVTFDVVGAPGRYLGGVIAPGMMSMTENLAKRTALLPRIDLAEPDSAIGRSTVEAMQIGAVIGYRGMIREILQAIDHELEAPPYVVATGGDAPLIARGLPEIKSVVPDLTLEGIRLIGEANL